MLSCRTRRLTFNFDFVNGTGSLLCDRLFTAIGAILHLFKLGTVLQALTYRNVSSVVRITSGFETAFTLVWYINLTVHVIDLPLSGIGSMLPHATSARISFPDQQQREECSD